ncbi:cytochrome P450 [Mycolicibacterium sp. 120266]|uniref:cytochrome P450 n=1 Tax=Mycolicibacterium sp. 120266 TaxID=3090601 RepID=UPI00299E8CEA|nr:cytochrome P450 [Mycolicibacterium sp. 120266]MDX1876177.1 cytochrome P450 [Mycolicibacterium sp. 120266]
MLAGIPIPADTSVYLALASANRDEKVFAAPAVFDVNREKKPHLAFGAGVHMCAGMWAARRSIGQIGVPTLYQAVSQAALRRRRPAGPLGRCCIPWIGRVSSDMVRRGQHQSRPPVSPVY